MIFMIPTTIIKKYECVIDTGVPSTIFPYHVKRILQGRRGMGFLKSVGEESVTIDFLFSDFFNIIFIILE